MTEVGEKLLTLPVFELEMSSFHQKLRFGNQIKEEKLEIFASVPYRSNTGKGKEGI